MLDDYVSYIVEFIGTFIFMYVIIANGQAIPIAITLAGLIFFASKMTNATFNPAVATMLYLNNSIDFTKYAVYLAVQLLAAICALKFYQYIKENN